MSRKPRRPLVADRRAPAPKPSKRRVPKPAKRRSLLGRVFGGLFGIVWAFLWRGTVLAGTAVGLAALYVAATLPPAHELTDGRARGSVTMLDRYGEPYAWRGDQFGGVVTTDTVSPHIVNAVVATEDKRFYSHLGLSPRGIASAVRINLREGRGPLSGHGGSTLTQQTAKLLCLGTPFDPELWDSEAAYEAECRQGSLERKAREAIFALGMEIKYTKDEILSIYLNRAFLGAGNRGFQAAMQRYFDKSAMEATPAEAAMLAGMLVAPTRYTPTRNLERSRARAATVLRLMEEQGHLTSSQVATARAQPATLAPRASQSQGGYFADWMMGTGPSFLTRETTEDVIITTTFDPALQRAAEDALTYIFETKVRAGSKAEAAIVVMSADGAVRAMVGGRDLDATGAFNRAVQAKRQTGSTFKPFVYATAMELGFSPWDHTRDEPLTINVPGSGAYTPKNYSNDFAGRITLTEALATSRNIPAVKISEGLGREKVQHIAREFGIDSALADGPALALGASESTLLEMTGAFAGILNGGSAVKPYGLMELRLQGQREPMLRQTGGIQERVISPRAAEHLTYMMHQVIETGTGGRAELPGGREAAGKTGTTQAARDAWFIGFTADYVAGVWMGYDDNSPLTGVTGSGLPADIWRETMARVHQGLPERALPMTRFIPRPVQPQPQAVRSPAPQPAPVQQEGVVLQVLRQILGND
ncbi:MAG: transglycosylase domain-containing protein [Shimia sp.]